MKHYSKVITFGSLSLCILLCAAPTVQAIERFPSAFWGQWGNVGPDAYLGPTYDRTCYLTGVHGQLRGANFEQQAAAYIYESGGGYWLATRQGNGQGVSAHADCIPATTNRTKLDSGIVQQNNVSQTNIKRVQHYSNRQCFITGIFANNGFADKDSFALISAPGTNGVDANHWELAVRSKPTLDQYGNYRAGGRATAVCVDVPVAQAGFVAWSGSSTSFSNEPGLACGLTMIRGNFLSTPPLGGNDGVRVFKSGATWWAKATSGKAMHTHCVK